MKKIIMLDLLLHRLYKTEADNRFFSYGRRIKIRNLTTRIMDLFSWKNLRRSAMFQQLSFILVEKDGLGLQRDMGMNQ